MDDHRTSSPWQRAGLMVALLLLGSKLVYFAQFPQSAEKGWDFWTGRGVSLYGGLLGVVAAAWAVFRYYRVSPWPYLDGCALSFSLGLAVVRLGCFLGGCNWGTETDLPWGVCFPHGSHAFQHQVSHGLVAADQWRSLPVHPTQLYESAAGVLLLGFGLWWVGRSRFHGQTFLLLLAAYAAFRFAEEYVRADYSRLYFGCLTFAQLVSLALVASIIPLWRIASRRAAAGNHAADRHQAPTKAW